ncbi:Transcript cleavage factor greA [Chlamydia trachomatis]|nr:Transcript cleavage factor greA [Chlamydia trachomatis]
MNKVTILNMNNNAQMTYTVVSETEANLREGKISITTPIAKGLLGHKVGEEVEVQAPAGKMRFKILEISI